MMCLFLPLSKFISFLMVFSELKWYLQKLLTTQILVFSGTSLSKLVQFYREFWSISSPWNWKTPACRLKIIMLIETSRATTGIWVYTSWITIRHTNAPHGFENIWMKHFVHTEGTIQITDKMQKGKICSVTWVFLYFNNYFVLSHSSR